MYGPTSPPGNDTGPSESSIVFYDLPWRTRIGVTSFFVVLYGFLFVGIAYQLFLIFYHRYKVLSYRTVFVILCLAWSALRVVMFALYFDRRLCTVAFDLSAVVYWLLYALPVWFQFATLSLFAHYYLQVVSRGINFERESIRNCCFSRWMLNLLWGLLLAVFVAVDTACVLATYADVNTKRKSGMGTVVKPGTKSPFVFPLLRVVVTEGLFLLVATVISACIVTIARRASMKRILEGEGMSTLQSTGIVLVLLYLTRTVYNIVATETSLGFKLSGYFWPIVADEVDYGGDIGTGYVTFSIVLFVWEFIPTVVVIILFRVKRSARPAADESDTARPVSHSYFQTQQERRPLLVPPNARRPHNNPILSSSFYASSGSSWSSNPTINA
eukprot:m.187730 g.187730  ORF g.187730 m.187730 type:complete len:385 (+) comp39368_c1_seq11:77-1231(+)